MLKIKRLCSVLLALAILISSMSMLYANAQEVVPDAQATAPETEVYDDNYNCSCICDATDCV